MEWRDPLVTMERLDFLELTDLPEQMAHPDPPDLRGQMALLDPLDPLDPLGLRE